MKKINLGFLFSLLMVPAAFAAVSITPKATAQASASQSSQASHAKPVSARAATGVHGGLLSSKSSGVKSNRSASTSKMSIGKYLGSSISKTNPGASMVTPGSPDMSRYATQDQIDNLLSMIDAINDSVSQAQTDVGAELANKADKVGGAVSGNLAGLDNTGNLTDSGVDPDTLALTADVDDKLSKKQNTLPTGSDGQVLGFTSGAIGWITPAVTDVSGKANLQTGAVAGNLAKINASGQYVDSGMSENDFATTTDVSNKQDKLPTGGGSGQVLSVDSSGNFTWVNQTTGKTYTGGDGIDINSADTISVKAATDAILGGVKLGASKVSSVSTPSATTEGGRYYPVQTDNSDKLVVNVPWTDTNPLPSSSGQNNKVLGVTDASGALGWVNQSSTYTLPAATDAVLGGVKLGASKVSSVSTPSATNEGGRYYPVQTDSSDKLVVNVPWTDTNPLPSSSGQNNKVLGVTDASGTLGWVNQSSTYTLPAATDAILGGVKLKAAADNTSKANSMIDLSNYANSRNYPVQLDSDSIAYVNLEDLVTLTTSQSISGDKTFSGTVIVNTPTLPTTP